MAINFVRKLFGRRVEEVQPTSDQIEAVWDGTLFPDHFRLAKVMSQGKDKIWLMAAGHELFAMSRDARQQSNWDAAEKFLCLALAYYLIGNALPDASTALGNLAMVYEQRGQFAIALRLQRYALDMKMKCAPSREGIARSLWLIGRAYAALGEYKSACEALKRADEEFLGLGSRNPNIARNLAWVERQIAAGHTKGELPPDD